jgi:hypothetical protein
LELIGHAHQKSAAMRVLRIEEKFTSCVPASAKWDVGCVGAAKKSFTGYPVPPMP